MREKLTLVGSVNDDFNEMTIGDSVYEIRKGTGTKHNSPIYIIVKTGRKVGAMWQHRSQKMGKFFSGILEPENHGFLVLPNSYGGGWNVCAKE